MRDEKAYLPLGAGAGGRSPRAVYDMLKPLRCEAQTRVLDHVYALLRAQRQSSGAQEQDEIS